MICYVCSRNATHRIYDDLKPVCNTHTVEAVNEEEGDIIVVSVEAILARDLPKEHNQQIDAILEHMRKLHDIQKTKTIYALSELADWLVHDLDKVCVMLDELRIDTEE